MKKHFSYFFILLLIASVVHGQSANDTVSVNVWPGTVINASFAGLGVEWDPFFWFPANQSRGLSEEDWQLIIRRIKLMKLQNVRMFILPNWYEPENDNADAQVVDPLGFKFSSEQMLAVYRYLDVCDSLHIDVNLTLWGARNDRLYGMANYWLAFSESNNWITAPNDLDEWAENVTAFLDFLFHQKNYSCIKYLTLSNEPNPPHQGFWTPDRINKKLWYREMYKRTAQRLSANHLRDKIQLIGADEADTDDFSWFTYMAQHADSVIDVLASHTYAFDIDQADYPAKIRSWVEQRADVVAASALPGTPFFITEFGTNNGIGPYQNPDVDTFARGFFLVDFAINAINKGTSLLSYWTLHDVWYQFGQLMQLGLWAYKDKDWQVRPSWYAWSALSNFVRKGDKVVYVQADQPENISAVALRGADGRTKIVIANRSKRKLAARFFIDNAAGKAFTQYVYNQATISSVHDEFLPPAHTKVLSGAIDTLSAQSIVFYNEVAPVKVLRNKELAAPETFEILENYPNPFSKNTTIQFHFERPQSVSLQVFNLRGELVKTLINNVAKNSLLNWSGKDESGKTVAKGVYLLVLRSNGKTWSKKIIFCK